MNAYGTVKLGPNDYLWSCSICGALVVNRHQHDQWHVNPEIVRPFDPIPKHEGTQ